MSLLIIPHIAYRIDTCCWYIDKVGDAQTMIPHKLMMRTIFVSNTEPHDNAGFEWVYFGMFIQHKSPPKNISLLHILHPLEIPLRHIIYLYNTVCIYIYIYIYVCMTYAV